jgi:hypothetical protein
MQESETIDSAKMLAELALVSAANSLVSDATLISNSIMHLNMNDDQHEMYRQAFWDLLDHVEKISSKMKLCFEALCNTNGFPLENC